MAKTKKTLVDDLNAEGTVDNDQNIDELNVSSSVQVPQLHDENDGDEREESADPEYVVLKGNCIRHDGENYRENSRIPVSGKDADRLLAAGVIADVQVIRQRALSAVRGVKITTE